MLDLPNYDLLVKNLTEEQLDVAERFWGALWNVYVRNKGSTSSIYWMEQMADALAFNKLMIILQDYLQSDVIPERNWAQVCLNEDKLLELFDEQELTAYRKSFKLKQYTPEFKESVASKLVRINGQVQKTGLIRKGFMKAGHTQYYYDTAYLSKYKEAVVRETNKGMIKMRDMHPDLPPDDAVYDLIAEEIVLGMIDNPQLMTQGVSYLDSRGRAIKESLSKVANPIGYKAFRALLTIPY